MLLHTLTCLQNGQTLLRIRMNEAFRAYTLVGRVVDVGGGRDPDYFTYFKSESGMQVERLDGSLSGIDFEKDALPYKDKAVDTVILANVLEHIYNHRFLLTETHRILTPNGLLVGFVPFWTGYHPDPHDYFRYTHEALSRLLAEAGYTQIRIQPLDVGPILANFNTIVLSMPRLVRPVVYLWYALWNTCFVFLRPNSKSRQPLGYVFAAHRDV